MSATTTEAPLRNTVRLLADGPLELRGEIRLRGEPIGNEAWLCRCGQSRNKPHCDGSHRSAGCALPGDCAPRGEAAAAAVEAEEGALGIEPRPNGPNRINGRFALLNAQGEVVERLGQGVFCRCGQSGKKPYCDGTHRSIGFVAP